jgi:hypothetical protein
MVYVNITMHDVLKYDDENETMVSVKFTEEQDGLSEEERFYKAEIIITTNDDCIDDDNVLCSEGLGYDVIKDLLENVSKIDALQYLNNN